MKAVGKISLGVLGCGTVGSALVELISAQADDIYANTGIQLEVSKIGVKSLAKKRPSVVGKNLLTQDLEGIVSDPNIDIIVELMGGVDPARKLLTKALENSKPVVSANKEVLAKYGSELFQSAKKGEVQLAFEASVAGAIPVVRTLQHSLLGEPVNRITGILNGTTNYILSSITESGMNYSQALKKAQELGYAERDPSDDVSGKDSAFKIAILASIAFGKALDIKDVYCEGIQSVDLEDINYARQMGYTLKLLATAEKHSLKAQKKNAGKSLAHAIAVRVHPAMVPSQHLLAKVSGSYNAIYIEGAAAGQLMLSGRGAGGEPTAAAVLGDILDLARRPGRSDGHLENTSRIPKVEVLPIDELSVAYYLRLEVEDSPGVLAEVAKAFGENQVSIRSMEQLAKNPDSFNLPNRIASSEKSDKKSLASLIFITHIAEERNFQATLKALRSIKSVKNILTSLRVMDFENY